MHDNDPIERLIDEGLIVHLHVHMHDDASGSVTQKLDQILTRISALERQESIIMTDVASVKQLVSDLNDETNTVAAKVDAQTAAIADLKAQLAAGTPVTQADLDAIAAGLTPISARLKAIGADPAQPIPPAV